MRFTSSSLSLVLLAACASASSGGRAPLPAPPEAPTLFAPGIVSSAAPEFAITFTPDLRTLYFNRATADRSSLTIMESRWTGTAWSAPRVASFSGIHRDVDPFVSSDGRRVYFSSSRPGGVGAAGNLDTWFVERTSAGWGDPRNAGRPFNTDSNDVFVSETRDGTTIVGSNRAGAARIFASRRRADSWEEPQALSAGAPGDGNALISPSGRFLVHVRTTPSGGADLWVACRTADGWSASTPLQGGVNSTFADFAPALSPDERLLFFTSERPGVAPAVPAGTRPPGDIYAIGTAAAGIDCA
ncbi:MAG: PD40 domain-containing protein [Cytophagaceae bacterium]|nr:PD40 domain-containing protein [Gemmatimonadaceae bacterium]